MATKSDPEEIIDEEETTPNDDVVNSEEVGHTPDDLDPKDAPKPEDGQDEQQFWGDSGAMNEKAVEESEIVEESAAESKTEEFTDEPPASLHGISGAESKSNNMLWVGIIVVVVLIVLGGGFWMYKNNGLAEATPEPTPQEEVMATPEPAATESEEVNFADYTVQVLNGSGTPGEAAKVQAMLEEDGFEEFEVGNASAYTYKETEIAFHPETPEAVIEKVKENLGKTYSVKVVEALDEDSEHDIVVTIGSKKAS